MENNNALSDCCAPALGKDASVLALGAAPPEELAEHWPNHWPDPSLNTAAIDPSAERVDLCILIDPYTALPKSQADQLIAQARDQQARQVIVLQQFALQSSPDKQHFLSLGFSSRPLRPPLATIYHAYGFTLASYKPTPDWLNARFWANPERWNKN